MDDLVAPRRALISVSDKTGIADFAMALVAHGVEILSTGGTARLLREAGVTVVEVSTHTGFPEILDGRVKTLVPAIHGGILGRRDDPRHVAQMQEHGIAPIDLVCVNLYPFEASVAAGAVGEAAIEEIDIGGPALIRAAAKNHAHVCVVTDHAQYARVEQALAAEGGTRLALRRALAGDAYARTAAYDAAIAAWFAREEGVTLPPRLVLSGRLRETLRYGENPHQQAGFYITDERLGIAGARQVQGKALSYNNINDTDAAYAAVAEFDDPAVVIVKHANPCGAAVGPDLAAAWEAALACDRTSAFGGIVACNRIIDEAAARRIAAIFTEVIVAPDASPEALAIFAAKSNLRVLLTGEMNAAAGLVIRTIAGGFLAQDADQRRVGPANLRVVTKRAPDDTQRADLLFAFRVCKHVKSNAIVLAAGGATIGVGAGQMSRVDAARIAAWKAREAGLLGERPCVAASDAFFPFADGLKAVIEAGAAAVIQPGGSMRDDEVIAAADEAGIAMVMTGVRHFRH